MNTNIFAKAIVAAQKSMANARKDSNNPFFKSKYADLNAIREVAIPVLTENGIAVLQPVIQKDGKSFVRTLLIHESGQIMSDLYCDVEILFSKTTDAQAQGSGITYARRYGLQSLLNVGAEDDDGNKASERDVKKGLKNRLANAAEDDMKEVLTKKNEDQFRKIKENLESCGSISELGMVWEASKPAVASLKKYAPDLYNRLIEAKDLLKTELDPENQEIDDSAALAEIGK